MAIPDPACMDQEELDHWRAQALYIKASWSPDNTEDPCVDCTIAFSREMQAEGRCNGIPGMARKVREETPDPGWRYRNRRDYFRRVLHDMGLDPAHAERVG